MKRRPKPPFAILQFENLSVLVLEEFDPLLFRLELIPDGFDNLLLRQFLVLRDEERD